MDLIPFVANAQLKLGHFCVDPEQLRGVRELSQLVATVAGVWSVTGCLFQIPAPSGTVPQPCLRVQWAMPSARIIVGGSPALLQPGLGTGAGACLNAEQAPQGPPVVNQMALCDAI